MLDELLEHDNLGNKRELEFVIFEVLGHESSLKISDVIQYSISNIFSIRHSINGIISLLKFMSFVTVEDEKIILNQTVFNKHLFKSSDYFFQQHFFDCLFKKLKNTSFFNDENLKFDHIHKQYYIKTHLVSFDLFPVKNLLIALNFLQVNKIIVDNLMVNKEFTNFFKTTIVNEFVDNSEKMISLNQLKVSLQQKNEAGVIGELFVLNYEKLRLKLHPRHDSIERISEKFVNAGFDVKSYNNLDSVLFDRFIEVKSYSREIEFYWSKNEIKKAKELQSKYFIYLVDRSIMNNEGYIPKIIQNPYEKIFENDIWIKEIENWKITVDDGDRF